LRFIFGIIFRAKLSVNIRHSVRFSDMARVVTGFWFLLDLRLVLRLSLWLLIGLVIG
jgi:hypothetical protein